ncbi:MAG: hypothetical protein IH941_00270 [Acidobacteria bacterium]|nr:hypothetical protein [Acidobacteriota bacterium]
MTTGIHMIDPRSPEPPGPEPRGPQVDPEPDPGKGLVLLDDDQLIIEHLVVTDRAVVEMVATSGNDDRADLLLRIMSVGVQGVASMGIGIDLTAIDTRVHRVLESVTTEAQATVRAIIDESRASLSKQFDPEQRSSILARALSDFTAWRDEFLDGLDPGIEGSAATVLIQRLLDLVGPDGALERRLAAALDMDEGDSAFARLGRLIDERFDELRHDLTGDRAAETARLTEAERGTAHGLEFEDVVEANLRRWASTSKGSIVERTSTSVGTLTASSKVGDFVVTLGDGLRIVVEAKRHTSITLAGSGGILEELDAAMANRRADAAVCIAGRDAFPAEVGLFNVYGNRVLTVDEGDGAMTSIAMQWAAASTTNATGAGAELDTGAIADRIDRIRKAAETLSGARRSVTTITASLGKLHETLGGLRLDVLAQVDDLDRLLSRGTEPDRSAE